jgi:hypothetical protein
LACALAVGVVAGRATAQTAQALPTSWQGHYVSADASKPPDTSVEVDVFSAYEGQALFVDFMVRRTSAGTVAGAVSPATNVGRKQFTFAFTDSEGRRGTGTFSRRGSVFTLRLDPAGPGGAAERGWPFGTYEVTRKETAGRSDRHPWSLTKPRPPQE